MRRDGHVPGRLQTDGLRGNGPVPPASPSRGQGSPRRILTRSLEQIPEASLAIGDEIGKGRFKRVHRGKLGARPTVVLRYSEETDNSEVKILALLAKAAGSRDHVPEIYGVCYERASTTSIVQELAALGSLKLALKDPCVESRLSPAHRVQSSTQLARAMAFLEGLRIVHADLSCRNVLLLRLDEDARNTVVKVTDFGLSLVLAEGSAREHRKQPQATRWCAPETIAEHALSHRSDVWSLGATLWELFSGGANPWVRRDRRADVSQRLRDLAENGGAAEGGADVSEDFERPAGCPEAAHTAILSCFQADELARPGFRQLTILLSGVLSDMSSSSGINVAMETAPAPTVASSTEPTSDVPESQVVEEAEASVEPSTPRPFPRLSAPQRAKPPALETAEPEAESEAVCTGGDASATEAVTTPWQMLPRPPALSLQDTEADRNTQRFSEIVGFLRSPRAVEVLGDRLLAQMWREIEDAQARETYLMELVRRMCDADNKRSESVPYRYEPVVIRTSESTPHRYEPVLVRHHTPPAGVASLQDMHHLQLLQHQHFREDMPRTQPCTPTLALQDHLHHSPVLYARSAEDVRPLRPCTPVLRAASRQSSPGCCGMLASQTGTCWTLWSLAGSSLRQQDYATEADARAAFDAAAPRPCILRDPSGAEVASQSWVASYYQLAPRIEITRCTTPVSIPSQMRQTTPVATTTTVTALGNRAVTPAPLRQPSSSTTNVVARPPLPRVSVTSSA